MDIRNVMGGHGGEPISGGTSGTPVVVPVGTSLGSTNLQSAFSCVKAINGSLTISAVNGMINYTSLLPITLQQGDVLYCPGAISISSTGGQGVAFYQ